jgi:hypothetical protein
MSEFGPEDERLEAIYDRLDELDPNTFETRAAELLHGLGFPKYMLERKTKDMSGEREGSVGVTLLLCVSVSRGWLLPKASIVSPCPPYCPHLAAAHLRAHTHTHTHTCTTHTYARTHRWLAHACGAGARAVCRPHAAAAGRAHKP